MNEIITENKKIENIIYEIREKQVMLDRDLAKLYGYAQLTKEESCLSNLDIKK